MVNQTRKSKKLGSLICFILVLSVFIPAISIAFARKPDRGPLEKIVFIHYRKGYGKPDDTPGVGPDKDKNGDEGDYIFLAKGVKWKDLPIDIAIGPDITESAITSAMGEWEKNTSAVLFGYIYDKIDASWDSSSPDGHNELVYGNYPDPDVIAVCIVWGYFRGPPNQREIIEFDILFDIDFNWGDAGETNETGLGNTSVMDLQNIATHELGHGLGLGDLYDSSASEETMYGYSECGETKKRTLYIGDIAGIQELYG